MKQENWISVKDRYPSRPMDVLVYVDLVMVFMGRYSQVSGWGLYDCNEGLVFGSKLKDRVTHWMPLPNPPKQEK